MEAGATQRGEASAWTIYYFHHSTLISNQPHMRTLALDWGRLR